jgi:outer membrane protein TolC
MSRKAAKGVAVGFFLLFGLILLLGEETGVAADEVPEGRSAEESEGSLSIERAVTLARQHAHALKLEERHIRRASLAATEAKSRLGPELTFSISSSYLTNPPAGITVSEGELGDFIIPAVPPVQVAIPQEDLIFLEDAKSTYFEVKVILSQPVFTWLKLRRGVDAAAMDVAIANVNLEESKNQICQELHSSYFAALLARESIVLMEDAVAILDEMEEDIRRSFELGLLNRLSLLEVRTRAASARRGLVEATEGYASALEAISFYTGLDPAKIDLASDFREELPSIDEPALKSLVETGSPAVRKLQLELEKSHTNLAILKGTSILRPDISLNVMLEITGQTVPWTEENWEDDWSLNLIVALGASGSLFDSGRASWKIRQAEQAVAAARDGLALLGRQLRLTARRSVQEVRLAYADLEEKKARLLEAEEAEKNARESHAQQLITRRELGSARLFLLQKRIELLSALHTFEVSVAALEFLRGTAAALNGGPRVE